MWTRRRVLTGVLLFCVFGSVSPAHEQLRIAAMGGTRIATSAADAGISGNPAALVSVDGRAAAFGVTAENLHWSELPKSGRVQFAAEADLDLAPTLYYSQTFGSWGASAGYAPRFANVANFRLESTDADYNRNARQFSATTDLFTTYSYHQEQVWAVGVSREIGSTAAGARLKWVQQQVSRGTLRSTLNLAARHGPEVDVAVPELLIAAIVEEVQFGDRVRELIHERQIDFERRTNRLEVDIGIQHEIWLDADRTGRPVQVGLLLENLLRADLVEPLPFRYGIGLAYEPRPWLALATDLYRDFGQNGVGFALGTEFQKTWGGIVPKSAALRIGAGRIHTDWQFAFGIGLRLGTAVLEYAMGLGSAADMSNSYLFAFTLRF